MHPTQHSTITRRRARQARPLQIDDQVTVKAGALAGTVGRIVAVVRVSDAVTLVSVDATNGKTYGFTPDELTAA